MKTIVLASNNKHKIKEIKKMLNNYKVLSLEDIGFHDDIEENGRTFKANALIKAKTIHDYLKGNGLDYMVIADDTGLCCNALKGRPGVYSARYAGDHNEQANRDKLRKALKGKNRKAYFICCIALYYPGGVMKCFEAKTCGRIVAEERGWTEFEYDTIF